MGVKILLIVESAAKCIKIEKLLKKYRGNTYICKASLGHIYHLDKKIDTKSFEPTYHVIHDRKQTIIDLKKIMKTCDKVYLCGDPDREGEQICYSLMKELKMSPSKKNRVSFNEITKEALERAVDNPRKIDMDLVKSQQTRAILDQLVGFSISPLLWTNINMGLSGGRCQSPCLNIINTRENDINKFNSESYFKVTGEFIEKGQTLHTELSDTFKTKDAASKFLNKCIRAVYKIKSITESQSKSSPSAPFITSTLQQEAGKKHGFSAKQTMNIAQKLYVKGHITYHRTDSVTIAKSFQSQIIQYINSNYGVNYANIQNYKSTSKGAQEAHECIRPTKVDLVKVTGMGTQESNLYSLIWKRTIASQMSDMIKKIITVKIGISSISKYYFVGKIEDIIFDGYSKIYNITTDNNKNKMSLLKILVANSVIKNNLITATESFTKASGRFTESSLVKELEKLGIGRPSTYANIVSVVQTRGYVDKRSNDGVDKEYTILKLKNNTVGSAKETFVTGKESNKLYITDIGRIVNTFLLNNFNKNIMDSGYTATIENDLDLIANGTQKWSSVLNKFYGEFNKIVKVVKKSKTREKDKYTKILGKDRVTNENIYIRLGKYGPVYQKGDCDKKNPNSICKYASVTGETLDSATMSNAVDQFLFPKKIGMYKNKEVVIKNGRFGCYLQWNEKNYSVGKGCSPTSISINNAKKIIIAKEKQLILEFDNIKVINGKYGHYINTTIDGKSTNITIPKDAKIDKLNLTKINKLIDDYKENGPARYRKFNKKKK
jgi:DNA topoisomerase-1